MTGAAEPYISAFWQQSTGGDTLTCDRGGAEKTKPSIAGPAISPGTSSWHYYGVQVGFTSTGFDVAFRFNGATTGPATEATPSITGEPDLIPFELTRGRRRLLRRLLRRPARGRPGHHRERVVDVEQRLHPDGRHAPPRDRQPAGRCPDGPENGWALFQQLAPSEFATARFDEAGMPLGWPRDRWTTAPYTSSQATLTAAAGLKELATAEAVDQVRNRIILRALAPILGPLDRVETPARSNSPRNGSSKTGQPPAPSREHRHRGLRTPPRLQPVPGRQMLTARAPSSNLRSPSP